MKKALLLLSIVALSLSTAQCFAQATGVHAEVFAVHDGIVGQYDLTGYTTYRVYVDFENDSDFLSAIYGLLGDDEEPDDEDMAVYINGDCFEELQFGNNLIPVSPEAIVQIEPSLAYDSFFTIGKVYSSDAGSVLMAVAAAANADQFCGSYIDDGAVFTNIGQPNGVAGVDQKVLVAQVTTNGSFDIEFCTQTFAYGSQDDENVLYNCWSLTNVIGGCTDPDAPEYDPNATVNDYSCNGGTVMGCMDETASNFNPNATLDDGSCEYVGCMDPEAVNYDPNAQTPAACLYAGCMFQNACNYDPDANISDGSCEYPGCNDPEALNYQPDASCFDEASCNYSPVTGDYELSVELYNPNPAQPIHGEVNLTDMNCYRVYLHLEPGDQLISVYSLLDDENGEFPSTFDLGVLAPGGCYQHSMGGNTVMGVNCGLFQAFPGLEFDSFFTIGMTSNCESGSVYLATTVPEEVPGEFCGALIDDGTYFSTGDQINNIVDDSGKILIAQITTSGSMAFSGCFQIFNQADPNQEAFGCSMIEATAGCTDPLADNYNPLATIDNGYCAYSAVLGCTDAAACNFVAEATDDDGSCTYPDAPYLDCEGNCLNDTDGDGICNELEIAGCTDENACNFVAEATDEDLSCTYPGCLDETACNYDPEAPCGDDELCMYITPYSIEGDDVAFINESVPYAYEETAGSVYTWEVEGGNLISGQGTAAVEVEWTVLGTGELTVTESIESIGCSGQPVVKEVTVNQPVTTNEIAVSTELRIYPNPADQSTLVAVSIRPQSVELLDLSSRLVWQLEAPTSSSVTIPTATLAPGVYFVRVAADGQFMTRKLVVSH
jgi:hypothetical protein